MVRRTAKRTGATQADLELVSDDLDAPWNRRCREGSEGSALFEPRLCEGPRTGGLSACSTSAAWKEAPAKNERAGQLDTLSLPVNHSCIHALLACTVMIGRQSRRRTTSLNSRMFGHPEVGPKRPSGRSVP